MELAEAAEKKIVVVEEKASSAKIPIYEVEEQASKLDWAFQ